MNTEEVKGTWKQLTGKIKLRWGLLANDELTQTEGHIEYLSGKVQERYGYAKDEAVKQVNEFFTSLETKIDSDNKAN